MEEIICLVEKRFNTLITLNSTSCTKQELVEATGSPRSTLDNIMQELEEASLVSYNGGQWRLTKTGKILLSVHQAHRSNVTDVINSSPLIDYLQPDSEISRDFIIGSDCQLAQDGIPGKVLESFFGSVKRSSDVRVISPVIKIGYINRFLQHTEEEKDGTRAEIVLPQPLFDEATEIVDQYDIPDRKNIEIFTCKELPIEYTLWMADDEAGVIIYSDSSIKGLITNSSEKAVQWAYRKYREIAPSKASSTPTYYTGNILSTK